MYVCVRKTLLFPHYSLFATDGIEFLLPFPDEASGPQGIY